MTANISTPIHQDSYAWKIAGSLPFFGTMISANKIKELNRTAHQFDTQRAIRILELKNQYHITGIISAASPLIIMITAVACGVLLSVGPAIGFAISSLILSCMMIKAATHEISRNNQKIIELRRCGLDSDF